MNFNNSYRIYLSLMEKHNSGRRPLSLLEGKKEAAHSFLQRGPEMRKQVPEHPLPVRDLRNVHDSGGGRNKRKDAKGAVSAERSPPIMTVLNSTKLCKLKGQHLANPWHKRQSMSRASTIGRCNWAKCPGLIAAKANNWEMACRRMTARYRLECCTASLGKYVFLCNTIFKGDRVMCHIKYHNNKHKNAKK